MADTSRRPSAPHLSAPIRLYAEWLTVAVISTLLVIGLTWGDVTARLDNILYDRAILSGERAPPDDIVVVAIDDRSLQAIGRWPWSRDVHVRAIEQLAKAAPRAIGYDVAFVEPAAGDDRLAAALAQTRGYLPLLIDIPGSNGAAYDPLPPVPPLAHAAAGIGHVNIVFDSDRIVREIYLQEGGRGQSWIQLAAMMAQVAPRPDLAPKGNIFWQGRPMLIPYGGGAGHIRSVSFVDLIEGRVPVELLRNRYVLIGATANGLGDSFPTPTSGRTSQMAGVEIQGHLLDALLRGRVITPATPRLRMIAALATLWLLLLAFVRFSPRANAQLALALLGLTIAGSFALLQFGQIWLPPAPTLLGLMFVYPFWGWRRLQAVSDYMAGELRRLASEQDDFPRALGSRERPREITLQLAMFGQAIGRLRDLRRFLADSLRNIPDALFVTDLAGQILLTNAEGRSLLQRLSLDSDPGSALGPLFAAMRPDDSGKRIAPFEEGATEEGQIEVVIEDIGHFDVRYVSQHDASNDRVGLIIRVVDLTRLKQAERHREDALQLLSHDMRAPQSAILTLLQSNPGQMPEAMALRIEKHARRTLDLAEDFVQLARAEAKPLERDEVDMNDVVMDAADDLWPQASARRITIDTVTGDEPALVLGDRQLLTRAIVNLIGNAIKYSEDDMVITCSVAAAADQLSILIADQGTGMTPEQLAGLFGRFQQGPREGVGLGLALVQMVVQRHGGDIVCESEPGQGTTFTITLPALPYAAAE